MLITFDDGYRDNFDLAVPILRERGIPATFFLPTAFLDSPRLPWWDHVAYVIKQTAGPAADRGPRPDGAALHHWRSICEPCRETAAIMTIIRAFLDQTRLLTSVGFWTSSRSEPG